MNDVLEIFDNVSISLKQNNINNYSAEAKIIISSSAENKNFYSLSAEDINSEKLNHIIEKRIEGIPLAKIINEKGFWKNLFYTNENTLDPRADSEILVESISNDYNFIKLNSFNFMDLCSGTGCIGLSILKEFKKSNCFFVELSPEAINVNKHNSKLLNLTSRSNFFSSDLLLDFKLSMRNIEFIVCNPPYIPSNDVKYLSKETLHDPLMALDGGSDGCYFYRLIISQLLKINYKGILYLEIDPKVRDNVLKLTVEKNLKVIYIKRDYLDLDRLIKINFQ